MFLETVRGPMFSPLLPYRAPGSRWNPDSQLFSATQLTTSQLIRSCHSWRSKPVIHSERDWFVDVTVGAVMPGIAGDAVPAADGPAVEEPDVRGGALDAVAVVLVHVEAVGVGVDDVALVELDVVDHVHGRRDPDEEHPVARGRAPAPVEVDAGGADVLHAHVAPRDHDEGVPAHGEAADVHVLPAGRDRQVPRAAGLRRDLDRRVRRPLAPERRVVRQRDPARAPEVAVEQLDDPALGRRDRVVDLALVAGAVADEERGVRRA